MCSALCMSFAKPLNQYGSYLQGSFFRAQEMLITIFLEGFPNLSGEMSPGKISLCVQNRSVYHPLSYPLRSLYFRQDYHDTSELYDISEYANSQPITEDMCLQNLGCGVPISKVKNDRRKARTSKLFFYWVKMIVFEGLEERNAPLSPSLLTVYERSTGLQFICIIFFLAFLLTFCDRR